MPDLIAFLSLLLFKIKMKAPFYWLVILLKFSCKQQVKTNSPAASKKVAIVYNTGKTVEVEQGSGDHTPYKIQEISSRINLSYLSIEPIAYNEIKKEKGEEVAEVIRVEFPLVRTADPLVEKYINDTIQGFIKDHFG
ncbi:hypothetical protein [Adhaeribacter soli]|uniref:Uncharacterized protein n=1 Tax=Adhaeribacter soli TaxID=2607655 RepID=A0A5N1J6X1_9BACT|nr:hypothetical protein [Adhaeribacter soli]KAA9340550.1 hypothetical protein F0P94_03740 [Adhaeribacter soli]